jgi:hypothetical protein
MVIRSESNEPDGECTRVGPKPHATGGGGGFDAVAPGTVLTFTVQLESIGPGTDGVASTSRAQRVYIYWKDGKLYEK